jgi:hypothetical protein
MAKIETGKMAKLFAISQVSNFDFPCPPLIKILFCNRPMGLN